ncbi:hypothetical protein BOTBODRAFT_46928 [Botryobasidium botryosum FD-172 SS1]|uniref:Uncharacterized protein n=1 Tax=Botryobasidium botryosum (strain FD-172 SS1) TaxID=930990 RepID=A0A067MF84_BOTB1|nr:hypothetical protein BOTBODRAFT_46928 [Botryobasidium botryosum FD-172 SS1]
MPPPTKRLSFPARTKGAITRLILSQSRIIVSSEDGSIRVFSALTGDELHVLEGHTGGVWALEVCSRKLSATSSLTSSDNSRSRSRSQSQSHDTVLVSGGSTDQTVRVWDLASGENTHVFVGHTATVRCLAVVYPTRDEGAGTEEMHPLIVTGSRDKTLRVWRLPGEDEPKYKAPSVAVDASADGSPNSEDISDNPYGLHVLKGHTAAVRALAADGRIAASGSYDSTVRVWDLVTGESMWELTGHMGKACVPPLPVYAVVLDPPRKQVCSSSMDGTVRIWSTETGAAIHTLIGHCSLIGLLTLSSTTLISAAADATMRAWDLTTGALQDTHSTPYHDAITCIQRCENKVVYGAGGSAGMWSIGGGSLVEDLLTGVRSVWQVAFDGRMCAAGVDRGSGAYIDVWGLEEEKVLEAEAAVEA